MIPDLSFVILTWNSEKTIDECLRSILKKCSEEKLTYEIHIIDNGSKDNTISVIENLPDLPVKLVKLEKNFGTTRTRNMGLRESSGEFICIMDSDAVLDEGSLRGLINELRRDHSLGIIAPKLFYGDGRIQASVKKFPSLFSKLKKIPCLILHNADKLVFDYPLPFEKMTDVDYAISACWFMRKEIIKEIGLLDEKIYYSPEDVDYCLRIWKKHKRVVYYNKFTVKHYYQRITHNKTFSMVAFSHLYGLAYFYLKHHYFRTPSPGDTAPEQCVEIVQ